jgi:hypothetical protein
MSDTKDPREIRRQLREKLKEEGRYDLAAVLTKCEEVVWMQCVCCTDRFAVERGCGKRWCPMCAPRIAAKRLDRAARLVGRFRWPLAVTLTMKNVKEGEGCVEKMKDAFRKFRRTDFWEDRVKGGVAGFEVTHRGRGFHPHLHALVDCRWLAVATPEPRRNQTADGIKSLCERAQDELAEVWGAYVQGKKASVWVNRAWGKSLIETLKYAIKPSDLLKVSCDASEIIDEIDRGRMMTTFGHAHACAKDFVGLDDPIESSRECDKCGTLKSIAPESFIRRMMENPKKLNSRWRGMMIERWVKQGADLGEVLDNLDHKAGRQYQILETINDDDWDDE